MATLFAFITKKSSKQARGNIVFPVISLTSFARTTRQHSRGQSTQLGIMGSPTWRRRTTRSFIRNGDNYNTDWGYFWGIMWQWRYGWGYLSPSSPHLSLSSSSSTEEHTGVRNRDGFPWGDQGGGGEGEGAAQRLEVQLFISCSQLGITKFGLFSPLQDSSILMTKLEYHEWAFSLIINICFRTIGKRISANILFVICLVLR